MDTKTPRFISCVTDGANKGTMNVTYLGQNGDVEHGTIPTAKFWEYLQNALNRGGVQVAERKTA